jgi:hypothetical protein
MTDGRMALTDLLRKASAGDFLRTLAASHGNKSAKRPLQT